MFGAVLFCLYTKRFLVHKPITNLLIKIFDVTLKYAGTHFNAAAYFKATDCSLNALLSIMFPPALQKSQCYSNVFCFSLPFKNKQANNKTISKKLTFQHFFPCFFTVISTNFLTIKPAQNTQRWPAAKLSWSVSPRRVQQQAGMIPVHTSGNLFTAAITNSTHLILQESMKRHFICVIRAPWALKLHS